MRKYLIIIIFLLMASVGFGEDKNDLVWDYKYETDKYYIVGNENDCTGWHMGGYFANTKEKLLKEINRLTTPLEPIENPSTYMGCLGHRADPKLILVIDLSLSEFDFNKRIYFIKKNYYQRQIEIMKTWENKGGNSMKKYEQKLKQLRKEGYR